MDDPSQQLYDELATSIKRALSTNRPILTHLNADTTWLVQLPYPRGITPPPGRSRFNILIDPWLSGPQSDVASWFSTQWHVIDSSVQTIAELNERLREVEKICRDPSRKINKRHENHSEHARSTFIDVVALSHEFTDHTHKETLLQLDSTTPIFATEKAADVVRSWHHFSNIYKTPSFVPEDRDWRKTAMDPLPHWIGISRIVTKSDALYYHSAIMIAFLGNDDGDDNEDTKTDSAEAILYSPHGIAAGDLGHLPTAAPPISTLALLHGLHDVGIRLAKQLNLGAHNGLKAQRVCHAKYWVGTHDEVKKGGGLVAPFLWRTVLTTQEAVEKEILEKKQSSIISDLPELQDIKFVELGSGDSLLIE